MDYEKKYKEALERASKLRFQNPFDTVSQMMEHVFPELKESEDERIRKELITHCRNTRCVTEEVAERIAKWIAWLEKQKPIEHFELKEGHWYVCHRAFCCRADHLTIKEGEKFMCEKDGVAKGFIIEDPEKYFKETVPPAPYEDEQGEQKSMWTEEDESKVEDIIYFLNTAKTHYASTTARDNCVEWLKSLKQRMEVQQ